MDNKKLNFRDIFMIVQTILLVVLIIQIGMLKNDLGKNSPTRRRQPPTPKKVDINIDDFTADSYSLGSRDAKATLVLFNSYTCGYCRKVRDPIMKLVKKYPNDFRFVYKHFNRGGIDLPPAQASECAGEQGKFWEMYNTIIDKGSRGDMTAYAKEIGLNVSQFSKCLTSEKYKGKTIKDTTEGKKLGVRSTPSFILNDTMYIGYKPYEVLEKMVREKIE